MRRVTTVFTLIFTLLAALVFAEDDVKKEQVNASSSTCVLVLNPGDTLPKFEALIAEGFVKTADYERLIFDIQLVLNQLSPMAAELANRSYNTIMRGDPSNLQRLPDVATNIMENLIAVIERYSQDSSEIEKKAGNMREKLAKLYTYNFGPEWPKSVKISNISNDGKGSIVLENDVVVRYTTTPGLLEAVQKHKEVLAISRLTDGTYKRGAGVFYTGQNTVTLHWDERTFKEVNGWLAYHRACKDQIAWLTNSTRTSININKSANTNTNKSIPVIKNKKVVKKK